MGAGASRRRPSHCVPAAWFRNPRRQDAECRAGSLQELRDSVSQPAASRLPLLTELKSGWSHPAPGEGKGVSAVGTSLTLNWKKTITQKENIEISVVCAGPHQESLPLKRSGS